MSYQLTFELPGLPKTPNGAHGHWQSEHGERKKWKAMTHLMTCGKRPAKPLANARLVLTRFSSQEPDHDNLVRSFKPIVDQLVRDGVLENDKRENIGVPEYVWQKSKPMNGKVKVEVYEI